MIELPKFIFSVTYSTNNANNAENTDIKMKVWKFESKPRAYFRRGLFSGSFSCSDLRGLFSGGAYFRRGLFLGLYGIMVLCLYMDVYSMR